MNESKYLLYKNKKEKVMKTRSIVSLLAVVFVLVLALTSCDAIFGQGSEAPCEHSWEEATCTTPKTCTKCDATEGEALGHTEQVIPGKAPTCTEAGYTEGKLCTVCGEVTISQEEIPAAHTEETVPGKEATCIATGLTDGKKCSVCGVTLVAQEETPLADHTEETVPGKAPTCTETGLTDGKKCTVCGATTLAQEGIPVADHTEEVVEGTKATCTEAGLTDGKKCSVCGATIVEQQRIPPAHIDEDGNSKCDACGASICASHSPAEAIKENDVPATCTEPGSYESVVKCSACGEEISRETVIVDAKGHDMEGVLEGTKKTYTCENGCGKTEVKYVVTVKYLNLDGTAIAEAVTYEYDNDTINKIEAKAIEGYVPSHDYVKVHILEAGDTVTIYYSQVDLWDGSSVSESLTGSGTQEDPYLVQSGADLAYIAKVVNDAAAGTANFQGVYFKMTKSIDLGGKELRIGDYTADKRFYGFFDGNNCTVRGINATQSLFGKLYNGYIKNLSTYGTVTTAEKKGVAGLVSYMTGATVENITNYVNVTGVQQVAGIVGWHEKNTTSYVKSCVNYGNIVASSYQIGGIAGFAKGHINDCTNFGDVSSSASGYVGGIGGSANDSTATRTNCVNYGNISGTDYVGGCFGTINKTTTDCFNYGTATGTGTNVGEVVGAGATYLTYSN